jgi:broad specificity phosphatase PhoE
LNDDSIESLRRCANNFSLKGWHQAQKTGSYLIDLLREKDIKLENSTVIFITSPFQRCIDTTLGVARGLQHPKQSFLRLEPAAGEWMTERFFEELNCTAHQMTQRKIQDIARNHMEVSKILSMDWQYSPVRKEFVYPESMSDMQDRYDDLRRSLDAMIARDIKANRIGMMHCYCCGDTRCGYQCVIGIVQAGEFWG